MNPGKFAANAQFAAGGGQLAATANTDPKCVAEQLPFARSAQSAYSDTAIAVPRSHSAVTTPPRIGTPVPGAGHPVADGRLIG